MAHRSRLAGFIIDCNTPDLDAAAKFWSAALGCAIDPEEASDATSEYVNFNDTPGGLHIEVQKVDHPSRVHLDIESDDIDAEAARLESLGAKKIAFVKRWWVMESPTGQRFCVVRMREVEGRSAPNEWA
ncbi:VOC family protein [Lysobacter sp. HA18]